MRGTVFPVSEPTTHRAWRYDAYGPLEQVLRLQELPAPVPRAGEVLVRVHHASINPLDWKLVQGQFRLFLKSKPPCGVATELAGDVLALGAGVTQLQPGQCVLGRLIPNRQPPGALAEQVVLPAAQVLAVPDGVDLALACTLPVAGVSALQLCRLTDVRRGTRLLVHGAAGGVGHASVLWARHLGARVTATGSADSQTFLHLLGADHVVDYRATPPAQWGGPFDAVIDCVATLDSAALAALLPQGGHAAATLPRVPGVAFDALLNPVRRVKRHTLMLDSASDDIALLLRALQLGRFTPVVTQRYALAEAPQALLASRGGHARGKLVVDVLSPAR
jgi:NADPH:quinone reductase-like Zn-dependent oxidoreductase